MPSASKRPTRSSSGSTDSASSASSPARGRSASRTSATSARALSARPWMLWSCAAIASRRTASISTDTAGKSAIRHAATAAWCRRFNVGSSSVARRSSRRAVWFASRASARPPAASSAAAASEASSGGPTPSSSAVSDAARSRCEARISSRSSPAALVQPGGEAGVEVGACGLRQARVGHVADQDVLEPVGAVARERRARLAQHELPQEQLVDRVADVLDVRRELLDRPVPEGSPDHRRPLEQRLLGGREQVDPRGDERLERVRDPLDVTVVALR